MADIVGLTPQSIPVLVETIRKVNNMNPVLRNRRSEGTSTTVLVPVLLSGGLGAVYDGTEQRYNDGSGLWEDAIDPMEWSTSDIKGQLREINGISGLDGKIVLATIAANEDYDEIWIFHGPGVEGVASFRSYIDGSGKLRFYDGAVWIQDNAAVVVSDDGTGYNPATETDYWVETVTIFGATSTTVTSTIQSGTLSLVLEETPTGTLVTRTPLLSVVPEGIIMKHEGDIWYDSVFTPSYGLDYRASVENNGKYFGVKEQTKTADSVDFTYFIEGIIYNDKSLAGEMVDHTEDTDNDIIKFGGVDEDDSHEYTNAIDTTAENEITFGRKSFDYKTRSGLVELLESSEAPDVIIKALALWIGIEAGGVFKHLNSPVTSTSDAEHWFYYSFSGIKNGAGGTVTITIYVDIKGHIWKVDTEEQPPPVENYRYTHCSDPSTYPDLIFTTDEGTTTILVSDQCYSFVDTTEADATSPVPTVTDTYASCAACEGALTNEQWKRCDNDADLAILTETHTDVDFAWLCSGAVRVKAYFDANTATIATDPTVLKQCGTTPIECADLVGWPSSDDFGGVGCNTGTIGDTNWGIRWGATAFTAGSGSIVSNKMRLQNDVSTGAAKDFAYYDKGVLAGDFTITADMDVVSYLADTTTTQNAQLRLETTAGGYVGFLGVEKQGGDSNNLFKVIAGFLGTSITNAPSSLSFKIVRSGSTITFFYDIGAGWVSAGNSVNNSANLRLTTLVESRWTGGNFTVDYDNILIVDGSSADIIIDPTGTSCT